MKKTDDTLILGNGVKTRLYTLPSATDSACQNQQNDLSNQRILFLSAWKTLIPYNCSYLYPFSVHSDFSGFMQKLFCIFAERIFHCMCSGMYNTIYLYKQNLMNDLSKLQILASHATIGVPVSFLLSSILFEKKRF